ncbi:MAG: EamA family transporter [Terriglobia bacterium]
MVSPASPIVQLTFLQIGISALLASGSLYALETPHLQWCLELVLILIYLTPVATLLAFFLITKYQKFTTPTRAAIIFSMEPLLAALFSYFTPGKLGFLGLVGASLIIAGLLISELSDVFFKTSQMKGS